MPQVGVQQPTNLMEMYGSFNPMMWDIASQQVNDQTLGNLINRQQAAQSMDIQNQKLPFELKQLGLQNQETQARIPGVQAQSGLAQNNLSISNDTMPQQRQAAISKLAKESSDADLTMAENHVKQMLADPNPQVQAQGRALFGNLYDIKKERDKLAITGGNAIALARETGSQQRQLEQQQYEHGKYLKPGTMSLGLRFNTLVDPIQIDTAARQLLADENLPDDAKAAIQARWQANKPAYDSAMQAKAMSTQGKVNAAELTGMPAVQAPTAQTPASVQSQQQEAPDALQLANPDQIKSAFQAGRISREKAKELLKSHGYK